MIKLLIAFALLLSPVASAATVNAASCSRADVESAMNTAANGDTVQIPAGDCTGASKWDATIDWNRSAKGDKALIINGAGIGQTLIESMSTTCAYNTAPFRIYGSFTQPWQFSGIEWTGCSVWFQGGQVDDIRIYDNKFNDIGGHTLSFGPSDAPTLLQYVGVVDHNVFYNGNGTTSAVIAIYWSNQAWDRDQTLGTSDALVFENNTFLFNNCSTTDQPAEIIAANAGARYVFRHNYVSACYNASPVRQMGTILDAHGKCQNPTTVGTGAVSVEIYKNRLHSQQSFRSIHIRGGKGVVYDNTLIGSFTTPLELTDYAYCSNPVCDAGELCGAYPCAHQVNNFYLWSNTGISSATVAACAADVIQVNRDFFETFQQGYTAYTYPHPLTGTVYAQKPNLWRRGNGQ